MTGHTVSGSEEEDSVVDEAQPAPKKPKTEESPPVAVDESGLSKKYLSMRKTFKNRPLLPFKGVQQLYEKEYKTALESEYPQYAGKTFDFLERCKDVKFIVDQVRNRYADSTEAYNKAVKDWESKYPEELEEYKKYLNRNRNKPPKPKAPPPVIENPPEPKPEPVRSSELDALNNKIKTVTIIVQTLSIPEDVRTCLLDVLKS